MYLFLFSAFVAILAAALTSASPTSSTWLLDKRSYQEEDGIKHTIFEHRTTNSRMDYVTNSGICETTPGVKQYSGYFTVGNNMNMWFWFFEARHEPKSAPLSIWLGGGPGCPSTTGIFLENGPCHLVNGSRTPSLNPYSFNEYANMLYIDQPIGTGFSYGTDDVNSTETAAPFIWKFLQSFLTQFPEYENRDFGIFTESYGGHYGPEFSEYFQKQNAHIDKNETTGEKLHLVALGINNGWYDASIQYKAYIDYSLKNTYRRLIKKFKAKKYFKAYNKKCLPAIDVCSSTGSNIACENAELLCSNYIVAPILSAGFDAYDIRKTSDSQIPTYTFVTYLQTPAIAKAIGVKVTFQDCSGELFDSFQRTGDKIRSSLPQLSDVVQSGTTVLLWAGDADWFCNWFGGLVSADSINFGGEARFKASELQPYTVNGEQRGTFKSVDNLSFLRVFGAGHAVGEYAPELALQVFTQTMQKKPIFST